MGALLTCVIALAACSETETSFEQISADLSDEPTLESDSLSDVDRGRVCRAAIAVLMGRDVEIVSVDRIENAIAYVSYVRPDDSSHWAYRCHFSDGRVVWSSVDDSSSGRWRDHPSDETIVYTVGGDTVSITELHADGSSVLRIMQVPN